MGVRIFLFNQPVDMAFLPKLLMAFFAAAAIIFPREAAASPMKKTSMSANKRELQEVIRRDYDERWARAITHVKAETTKREMDERSMMHLSKQYATGIGCECKCHMAPPHMFKKEAAAAAASRGDGGSGDAMKPRIGKRSVVAKREKMTRAEKKKAMKKLMKEAEKRKEKKHEKEELKKKEEL